jgi:hypothetical protein
MHRERRDERRWAIRPADKLFRGELSVSVLEVSRGGEEKKI